MKVLTVASVNCFLVIIHQHLVIEVTHATLGYLIYENNDIFTIK